MVIMPQIESNYFFKRVKNDKRTLSGRQKIETLPPLPCKSSTNFNLKQGENMDNQGTTGFDLAFDGLKIWGKVF